MGLVTMNSCKYLFVLIAFIILGPFDPTLGLPSDDRENDKKYIAFEETVVFLKELEKLYRNTENLSVLKASEEDTVMLEEISTFETVPTKFFTDTKVNGSEVKLLLYTQEQPDGTEIDFYNLEEIKFNPSYPTRIICHGWRSSGDAPGIMSVAKAYLAKGGNNVITVDWSVYAKDIVYPVSAKKTEGVGKYVADIIDSLVEKRGAQYSDIHIIGHSLGSHVAGFAGNNTKEKVGRITGLDPALPGFQYQQGPEGRLDETDAAFVDIIHTCSGVFGMSVPVGHVDFFPNGGSPFQPGCGGIILPLSNVCSHTRSYDYFRESITKTAEFTAIKCDDWDHFKKHNCGDTYALMGEYVPRDARGVFYLNTNDEAPFAKGIDGTVY